MNTQRVGWFGKVAAAGALTLAMAAPVVQAQTLDNQHRRADSGVSSERDVRDQGRLDNQGDSRDQAARRSEGDYRNQGSYDRNSNSQQNNHGDYRAQAAQRSQGDYRSQGSYDRNGREGDRSARSYRDNERVQVQGRVTSYSRERDGYRVYLDRGAESYWVPQSYFRGAHNLRVGISVVLGGVFRGGAVNVDAVNWPDDGGYYGDQYGQGYVSGVVERVNYRTGTMMLRDDRSGRAIAAGFGRYDQRGLRSIRPGDYVELSGGWDRGGIFDIARIETIRTRY